MLLRLASPRPTPPPSHSAPPGGGGSHAPREQQKNQTARRTAPNTLFETLLSCRQFLPRKEDERSSRLACSSPTHTLACAHL
ncbi:hypothetical protein LSTR_LSTR005702 [Laodelphax striatellus]|uniref:Uncharacterized protein n=1 Tax=Laodelphax striatellus TaxID=195883 RepID=A0A482XNG2_LAOST|nr:hypothetical protein LSTR_LSTR005702 [Laodelphax striatellus]